MVSTSSPGPLKGKISTGFLKAPLAVLFNGRLFVLEYFSVSMDYDDFAYREAERFFGGDERQDCTDGSRSGLRYK